MKTTSTIQEKPTTQRFKTGIEFQKELLNLTRAIQQRMLDNLPSNYSKDQNTNLAEFFRSVAKEFARLQTSISDVNEDKYHEQTRTEYLFQILGDSLFLGDKTINENLDDISYRNFLIKVRNAYFNGSRKDNIEAAVSDIIGLPVTLKEVYLDLRKKDSFYTIKDTHKMFFDIIMDEANASTSVGLILEDIKFFIDLIKPAHVLYDTRLVWTDKFKNREGSCKPSYITQNMEYEVYGSSLIYIVTYLSTKIYKYADQDPEETWVEGVIEGIDLNKGIFYLQDKKILVYNSVTELYVRDIDGDRRVLPQMFQIGDVIKYYAVKDSSSSSDIIDTTWGYTGIVQETFPDEELIYLEDDSIIVYNTDTLAYTRDYFGEYRIDVSDIGVGREIAIKAEKYVKSFQFYITPEEIQQNFFKQFDSKIIAKPVFQEYVKKNKDIPDNYTEGYQIVVENNIAVIKNINSKFYKKDNAKNYKEVSINRYNLYIDDVFTEQFSIDDAQRALTIDEAKNVFINVYGYTGIQAPDADYDITLNNTGVLIEDSSESVLQAVNDQTEFCDQRASCQLNTYYEDTRKYYTWPDVEITSGFFTISHTFEVTNPPPGAQDIQAWYVLSSDDNVYRMPLLPMLGSNGDIAVIEDITFYLNGKLIDNAIGYLDPWNGIIGLTFIPPFGSNLRIDYYYSKRYPDQVFYLRQVKSVIPEYSPNNLPAVLSVIGETGMVSRLSWPYIINDPDLSGDDLDYQMDKFPILNQRGELATKDDIGVQIGSQMASGTLRIVSIDTILNQTVVESLDFDWLNVAAGDTIIITAENYLDNSYIYVIQSIDTPTNTCIVPNAFSQIGAEYPYIVVKFNNAPEAVTDIRPLLGHIRVNFLPPVGSFLKFNYYYTSQKRNYLLMPDESVDASEGAYKFKGYAPDTVYGPRDRCTILVDESPDFADTFFWEFDELLKVGYRYRGFSLSNSSVLNSEKMILNDYQKNKGRASFNHGPSNLNRYGLMFSPEFLNDTDKNVILNDKYLSKNLKAVTTLNPGVPFFAKTQTDDGHHKRAVRPIEHDTYDPDYDGGKDLYASFYIIEPDDSGLIDYNEICEYQDKGRINLYSDLKIVEHPNSGYDADLSTIDEGGTSIPFKFKFIDQYYPDRELRINDYLDYINQVPTEIKTGNISVLNGSAIVKSVNKNFKALNVGDQITVENVPVVLFNNDTKQYETVYRSFDYVLIKIIDYETGVFNKAFKGKSGNYSYTLTRSKTYAVDVYLAKVSRTLVLKGDEGYTYGLPDSVISHLPPGYSLNFPDPDPDPYPRNPDNPWIGHPDVSYYNIQSSVIDGKTYLTNRTKGVTGIVNLSYIIDAEGMYAGVTGMAGVTGPSGAMNLGITGPVEYANPRQVDLYDVYRVPSGDTGAYLSYSEAEYRVQWRNWDQDMTIVNLTSMGFIEEDPLNMMGDIGDNIMLAFWDVAAGEVKELRFSGTLITSTEKVSDSVQASLYPQGLILLTVDNLDSIRRSSDPVIDLPELNLNDSNYQLNKLIIRELQHDDLIRIMEIQQFIPIS